MPKNTTHPRGSTHYKPIHKVQPGDVISCPPVGTTWAQGWEFGDRDRVWRTVRTCKRFTHKGWGAPEIRYRIYTDDHHMLTCPVGQHVEVRS